MDKDFKRLLEEAGINFPCRIMFLLKNTKGKLSVVFSKYKNEKNKLENIKYKDFGMLWLDGSVSAPLGIEAVTSAEELDKRIDELREKWLIK